MKLYYFTDACSLAPHVLLREVRQEFELVEVDYRSRRLPDGTDYRDIHPIGSVPVLDLGGGELLTEVSVILQYLASRFPGAGLLPSRDGLPHYRCLEWLNFIATELHKSVSPLFRASTPTVFLESGKAHLVSRFVKVANHLGTARFLVGDRFTVADIYLYAVSRWLPPLGINCAEWPGLARHHARLSQRPSVRAALDAEGLVPLDLCAATVLPATAGGPSAGSAGRRR